MITVTPVYTKGHTRCKWLNIDGYVTNITELSFLFGINCHTLRNRYLGGWNIEVACLTPTTTKWNASSANEYAKVKDFETEFMAKMATHFKRPPATPPTARK